MGQAALIFLIGTMIGMGGIPDDPALAVEDPIEDPAAEIDVPSLEASIELQADEGAGQAQLETTGNQGVSSSTAGVSVQADTDGLQVRIDAVEAAVMERVEALPTDPAYLAPTVETITVDLTPTPTEPEDGSRVEHVAVAGPVSPPAPESPSIGAIAAQIAPAAAATAIAAIHVEPTLRGWRRLLPFAGLAPLYSRISREDVLKHETRAEVYDLLKREPGLSLEEIADELDLSRSTTRHHVRVLVDQEMIAHTRRGRCRIHFPVGHRDEAVVRHLLTNENRARVAQAIAQAPRSLTEIAEKLDENAGSVHFHLKKLCEAGVVERRENGSVTYEAASKALSESVEFTPVSA